MPGAFKASIGRVLWKVFGLGARCPYCRSPIYLWDTPVLCERCMTAHHQDCWKEADRCSVFACGSTQYYIRTEDQPGKWDDYRWWWSSGA
jgi:hypothetical protein